MLRLLHVYKNANSVFAIFMRRVDHVTSVNSDGLAVALLKLILEYDLMATHCRFVVAYLSETCCGK
jgi:hypothetical protein